MQNAAKTFTTSDLGVASFLLSKGYRLLEIDRSEPRRQGFVFQVNGKGDPEMDARTYLSGTATVNALGFFNAVREAKRHLFGHN